MNAKRFNSETLKNAMKTNIKNIMMASTNHNPLAFALLHVENAPNAKTTQIARMISWIKLIENHIIEKAAPEKNHFFICWGNITFIYESFYHVKIFHMDSILIFFNFANFWLDFLYSVR